MSMKRFYTIHVVESKCLKHEIKMFGSKKRVTDTNNNAVYIATTFRECNSHSLLICDVTKSDCSFKDPSKYMYITSVLVCVLQQTCKCTNSIGEK